MQVCTIVYFIEASTLNDITVCRALKKHMHSLGDLGDSQHTSEKDRIAVIARLMITYGVSYECYHELRQQEKGLPPMYKVCISISTFMCIHNCKHFHHYIDQAVSRGASHTTY